MSLDLPLGVDQITADWLTGALRAGGSAGTVESLSVRDIVWGTATKVLVDLTTRGDDDLPTSLCVKGGFVPDLLAIMATGYATEARFYAEIAPHLAEGAPRSWLAGVDEASGQAIVVLDDLAAAGATFCDAREPLSVDEVARGLEILAGWHARVDLQQPWLSSDPYFRAMVRGLWDPQHHATYAGQASDPAVLAVVEDRERLDRAFTALWQAEDARPATFIHGDANLTNVCRSATGRIGFLDWQFASRSDAMHDVGLFLIGALSVADRREAERSLIDHYLAARGETAEPFDTAWTAYRLHTLHGAMYALTPEQMQPAPIRDALCSRYAAAAHDLETFAALGV